MFLLAFLLSCRFHLCCTEPYEVQLARNISFVRSETTFVVAVKERRQTSLFFNMKKHFNLHETD